MAQSALLAGHPAGTPAPDARTSATRFVALCEKQLQLAPEQAASLHTYLDQEVTYLGTLAANGLDPEPPTLVPTEAEQLNQVMVRLLSRIPLLRRLPARLLGLGVRPEHVKAPEIAAT